MGTKLSRFFVSGKFHGLQASRCPSSQIRDSPVLCDELAGLRSRNDSARRCSLLNRVISTRIYISSERKFTPMFTKNLIAAAFGLSLMGWGQAAQAITIDLDDFSFRRVTEFSVTADGLTATFSNAASRGAARSLLVIPDGVAVFDNEFFNGYDSLALVFDHAVQLVAYTPGLVSNLNGNERVIISTGSSSTVETGFIDEQLTDFTTQLTVEAGQILTFRSVFSTGISRLLAFRSLEVNLVDTAAQIPEPGSLVLFGAGLAGLAAVQRRRQKGSVKVES
ncbi:PEP-CTERM sorting domain-containing protein [Pelagibius sp. Alg239-R121]|uniref:PEP-CTERM sorting domain-containing protein n=1 Tax=Pelagibius sp. Alg239-R121 TaxID=2993448 RepID=UPI0024A765E8|nr:PEP-CTERM sorting domain-containing protein [Pelagibius sp. Alg239-R121]